MPDSRVLPLDQATALAALVELEARWENLPRGETGDDLQASVQALRAKQGAYVAYHTKLVAYNRRYAPAHEGETVLRSPARLAAWCRAMRDLLLRLTPGAACLVHLLEKAVRRAERLGTRIDREPLRRATPTDMPAAIRTLASLADWCDGLVPSATAAP